MGREKQIYSLPQTQEEVDLGLGQTCGADRESGSVHGVGLGSGQTPGEDLRLGQDYWIDPSPSSNSRPSPNGVGSDEPTHMEIG